MKNKLLLAVAIIMAPLIVAGIVCGILLSDESMLLLTLLLAAMYTVYLVKLIPRLKKEKENPSQQVSPLSNRR